MIKILTTHSIKVIVDGQIYSCDIRHTNIGYYLNFPDIPNSILFDKYHIDKQSFYYSVFKRKLEHDCLHNWPWCNNEKEVLKLLFALDRLIDHGDRDKCIKQIPILL